MSNETTEGEEQTAESHVEGLVRNRVDSAFDDDELEIRHEPDTGAYEVALTVDGESLTGRCEPSSGSEFFGEITLSIDEGDVASSYLSWEQAMVPGAVAPSITKVVEEMIERLDDRLDTRGESDGK